MTDLFVLFKRRSFVLLIFFLLFPLTGIKNVLSESKIHYPPGITWEKGAIEKSFEKAEGSGKPIFLYWGAVWCPPCNRIKKEIFSDKEIQKKLNSEYISIYLDGDSHEAPIWGEKFKTQGYPTLIFLNKEGKEVYRLTYLTTKEIFSRVLDIGIHSKGIFELLTNKDFKFTIEDYFNLANYSWSQDEDFMKREDRLDILRKIYKNVSNEGEKFRAHLVFNYLYTLKDERISVEEERDILNIISKANLNLNDDQVTVYVRLIKTIIEKFDIKKEAIYQNFKKLYLQKAKDLAFDLKSSLSSRILGFDLWLDFEKEENASFIFSKESLEIIEKMAKKADNEIKDVKERTAHFSNLIHLLSDAGLTKMAIDFAKKEASEKNKINPYYYMSTLAYLYEKEGNQKERLHYARKSWKTAQKIAGETSKLQWGVSYLTTMIEFLKEELSKKVSADKKIVNFLNDQQKHFIDDGVSFFKSAIDNPLTFKGRNKVYFESFLKKLNEIGQEKNLQLENLVTELKDKVKKECKNKKNGDKFGNCSSIISKL